MADLTNSAQPDPDGTRVEVAVLHVCPHCQQVFDSPSVCVESGMATEPQPVRVSLDQAADLYGPFYDPADPTPGAADNNEEADRG